MQINKNTKGFTLVELIIVITIIAVLWTIGFVSFQGYTKDARNTKRTSDLATLSKSLEAQKAGWVADMTAFIGTAWTKLTTLNVAWTWVAGTSSYSAGTPNYSILNGKKEDFMDGVFEYKIWVVKDKLGWVYQLAAKLEWDTPSALVVGNYKPRNNSSQSGALVSSVAWTTKTYKYTNASDYGFFKVWDKTVLWIVTSITKDQSTFVTDTDVATATSTFKRLSLEETDWLIWSGTTVVTNNSTTNLPY